MGASYLKLSKLQWQEKIKKAWDLLNPRLPAPEAAGNSGQACRVCPRNCKVNRTSTNPLEIGFCQVKDKLVVSSAHPHFGEERCLVGTHGSGTIFFTSCNLACVYCQNYEISQLRRGQKVSNQELAEMMVKLQNQRCHNINLVSPTIWVPQILRALKVAVEKGLNIPLVYNTGGCDAVETLKLLDGIVDIYMPDIKYADNKMGQKYSLVPDYWDRVRKAIKEMHRQVGDLIINSKLESQNFQSSKTEGLALRGLLVRHLVLPNRIAGSEEVMRFLSEEISQDTYVNIMDQYYPSNKALKYPELSRRITSEEYSNAVKMAKAAGLWRFDKD